MSLADAVATWIASSVRDAGLSGAVVGLSGGIDSAVVSGLCARGLGEKNVLGLIMPAHSMPEDAEHAELAARTWGIDYRIIELSEVYDRFIDLLPRGSTLANANLKPRLRMITLYHHANTLNRMVVGTGNRSELMVGYFTKYGDAGVDLLPLAGLYKHQVRDIAREIGVPEPIIARPPSAGLWEGQTDEAEMGISYADLDRILDAIDRGQHVDVHPDLWNRVERMLKGSEHKRQLPPIFTPPGA
ncbi:MAG TPA: NAD+ synthase [Thermomicrobiales bacterium]|nr:NAD+ synthase [Thermomicrobiales bacterium]